MFNVLSKHVENHISDVNITTRTVFLDGNSGVLLTSTLKDNISCINMVRFCKTKVLTFRLPLKIQR